MFIRPMYFTLKRLLTKEGLMDVKEGGLSTQSLQILILAFLDIYEKNHKNNTKGSGKAFVKFLKFYSTQFDPKFHQIQIYLNNTNPFKYTTLREKTDQL